MITDPEAPDLTVVGRIPSGSNMVFLCADPDGRQWVYKPIRGERPLYDFPDGTLAAREVASYLLSDALGWDLVPRTLAVMSDGGPGMAQEWITESESAPEPVGIFDVDSVPAGFAPVMRGEDGSGSDVVVAHSTAERIRRVALFDHVINNADRKGGHLLVDTGDRIWAIDHGLALHIEPKLRTVLWGWAGRALDDADTPGLEAVAAGLSASGELRERLEPLLSADEIAATELRVEELLRTRTFPVPGMDYPLPWPLF